jgi:ribonuclease HII
MSFNFNYEIKLIKQGFSLIAGVDEAGIGPLAGPVVAAAVMINPQVYVAQKKWWQQIRDSKKLSEKKREDLFKFICDYASDFAIQSVAHETIDKINILQASLLAMKKSIDGLKKFPDLILIDGRNIIKDLNVKQEAIIKGDDKILSIASASILAKAMRDNLMKQYHEEYPQYNFVKHKGYPTREHRMLIKKFGPCPIHRKNFGSVKEFFV